MRDSCAWRRNSAGLEPLLQQESALRAWIEPSCLSWGPRVRVRVRDRNRTRFLMGMKQHKSVQESAEDLLHPGCTKTLQRNPSSLDSSPWSCGHTKAGEDEGNMPWVLFLARGCLECSDWSVSVTNQQNSASRKWHFNGILLQ